MECCIQIYGFALIFIINGRDLEEAAHKYDLLAQIFHVFFILCTTFAKILKIEHLDRHTFELYLYLNRR